MGLALLALASGCTRNGGESTEPSSPQRLDGVEVGNGGIYYVLNFSEFKLQLSHSGYFKTVEISSTSRWLLPALPEGNEEAACQMEIHPRDSQISKTIADFKDLLRYVKVECAHWEIEERLYDQLPGLACKNAQNGSIQYRHFIRTPRGDLVILSSAAPAKNKLLKEQFADFVDSFRYDPEPPEVMGVTAAVARQGSKPAVLFDIFARDVKSGMMSKMYGELVGMTPDQDFFETGGKSWNFSQDIYPDEFDHWHTLVNLPNPLKPGTYCVKRLHLWDNLGNLQTLTTDKCANGRTYLNFKGEPTSIPLEIFEIKETVEGDSTPPVIREVEIKPTDVEAGGRVTLRFRSEGGEVDTYAYQGLWGELSPLHGNSVLGPRIRITKAAREVGNGWHEVDLDIDPLYPSDEYGLDFFRIASPNGIVSILNGRERSGKRASQFLDVKDHATPVSIPTLRVHNPKGGDRTAPTINYVKFAKPEATAGETAKLIVYGYDRGADLPRFTSYSGKLVPESPGSARSIFIKGAIQHVRKESYDLVFPIPDQARGKYVLQAFTLSDRIGNTTRFRVLSTSQGGWETMYRYYEEKDQKSLEIPLQTLTVISKSLGRP